MQHKYHDWAQKNDFESKLSIDVKVHKQQKATENDSQSTLNAHLHKQPPPAEVIKYSNATFTQAAIEWLVATNQVCFQFICFVYPSYTPFPAPRCHQSS